MSYAGESEEQYVRALRSNDVEAVSVLIEQVDDVDLTTPDGRTALMFLSKRNKPELVLRLLGRGADPNALNSNGGTPLMYAAISGNVDIVRALVEAGGEIDARGSNGWSAMMVAAAKGHVDLITYLVSIDAEVDTIDVYGWTPLVRASYENRLDVVRALLESGKSAIDHRDDQGATSLHHAAGLGYDVLARHLLSEGAGLMILDNKQLSPLDRAKTAGHDAIVKMFCEHLLTHLAKHKLPDKKAASEAAKNCSDADSVKNQ